MTDQLHAELSQAGASLRRCDCGSKAVMSYEPGCVYVFCLAEKTSKLALPDFQPKELARIWNERKPR